MGKLKKGNWKISAETCQKWMKSFRCIMYFRNIKHNKHIFVFSNTVALLWRWVISEGVSRDWRRKNRFLHLRLPPYQILFSEEMKLRCCSTEKITPAVTLRTKNILFPFHFCFPGRFLGPSHLHHSAPSSFFTVISNNITITAPQLPPVCPFVKPLCSKSFSIKASSLFLLCAHFFT